MATAKTSATEIRPLIQIDDEVREMTEIEYEEYKLGQVSDPTISTG